VVVKARVEGPRLRDQPFPIFFFSASAFVAHSCCCFSASASACASASLCAFAAASAASAFFASSIFCWSDAACAFVSASWASSSAIVGSLGAGPGRSARKNRSAKLRGSLSSGCAWGISASLPYVALRSALSLSKSCRRFPVVRNSCCRSPFLVIPRSLHLG
jgi:hypothetical protein